MSAVGIAVVLVILAATLAWSSLCPNCKRPLAKKKTGNALNPARQAFEPTIHYRCKYCDHTWERSNDEPSAI